VPARKFVLHTDHGADLELALDDRVVASVGGARKINGRRVELTLSPGVGEDLQFAAQRRVAVRSLRVVNDPRTKAAAGPSAQAVTGTQKWISILCKFSDVSSEPRNLSYFQGMYSSSYPGLDYYWREISYDKANVAGSGAVAWVTLPHPVGHYYSSSGGDTDALLADCTAAADSMVYFPDYVGINMMFNAEFGPYAWGGTARVTRDGVTRYYRVTWEPPWGYANMGVIAHEMGHGFGLPHSNNADGDGSPYDNPWDVMSDSWNYVVYDSTYGKLGKGTIGYHRDILGWIDGARKIDIDSPGIYNVTLDHLTLAATNNLRLVNVHIPGSNRHYTAEVRDQVSFDSNLPDFAVVIHEVDPGRREDAWLVDIANTSNGADEGAMWRVGECFEDEPNEISICVQSVAAEGFNLRIFYGETGAIFDDGFEDGNLGQWFVP
jgi:M6 family metalloprotease-like protein